MQVSGSRSLSVAETAPDAAPLGPDRVQDRGLFDGGPPLKTEAWLGLVRPGEPRVFRRAVLAALIGWLPLATLSALQSLVLHQEGLASFVSDFSVHARSLIAAPLFILAEAVLVPRMGAMAQHFLESGLVRDRDRERFRDAQVSTRRLRDSVALEALVIVIAYALAMGLLASIPPGVAPAWQKTGGQPPSLSMAGWWHGLVSLPLLVVLFLGWIWRLFLWTRFLWLMSRLDLRLLPAHPDQVAGLLFVGHSVRACGVIGFTLGTVGAGTVANNVVHQGASPFSYRYPVAGLVVSVLVLCTGPLLAFSGRLLKEWRRGVLEYGALADKFGRRFESQWLNQKVDEEALHATDFSAATDLYSVVANVYAMHLVPVERKSILLLVIATLLPFLPVLLVAMPLDTLFSGMANLLF